MRPSLRITDPIPNACCITRDAVTTTPQPDQPAVMRSKTLTVHPIGAQTYRFRARLTDVSSAGDYGPAADAPDGREERTIHDFGVTGVIEGPALAIAEITLDAATHPYHQCPAILPSCEALVGCSLANQWRAVVLDTFRATAGCTHVTTLLLGLAEARTMVFFLEMNARTAYNDTTLRNGSWTATGLQVAPTIEGACHVLAPGAPNIQRARAVTMNRSSSR
ncbi:DUF2889 domain-containing protein [Mycobacterium saskatchewanense]|uniref:DUF2889 domain-containing protein n=1 Tax=Mycobacterium saskatchewanense TaxID=220927 RepID=A0AAJ3NS53_9MYCO|nr:DUF2889 domain-containing protein [Mycobacterium saskatchewanense]ORW73719.1 hypothetical protein AWC23_06460 [Mycobacterium saskatchewanense]